MRLLHALSSLLALSAGCNMQKPTQQITVGNCPKPGAPGARLALADAPPGTATTGAWLGGVVDFQALEGYFAENPDLLPEYSPDRCSSLFEFSKDAATYSVRLVSNDRCMDFLPLSPEATVWVWRPGMGNMAGGYLRLHVGKTGVSELLQALREAPEAPRRGIQDIFYSGLTVPFFPVFATAMFPNRSSDIGLLCASEAGKPADAPADAPIPPTCIWPHGLKTRVFPVEPVEGSSTEADLDRLVTESTELRKLRTASNEPNASASTLLKAYEREWDDFQAYYVTLQHWAFARNTLLGKNECTDATKAACLRWAAKHFLPEKKFVIESIIGSNYEEAKVQAFLTEYNTYIKATWAEKAGHVLDDWKAIAPLLEQHKEGLEIYANLPDGGDSTGFRPAPLFRSASRPAEALFQGIQWIFRNGQLHMETSGQILRRPMDAGAVITLGGVPVLSLLRNTPHSEGASMMPLPVPRARERGGTTLSGTTGSGAPVVAGNCGP